MLSSPRGLIAYLKVMRVSVCVPEPLFAVVLLSHPSYYTFLSLTKLFFSTTHFILPTCLFLLFFVSTYRLLFTIAFLSHQLPDLFPMFTVTIVLFSLIFSCFSLSSTIGTTLMCGSRSFVYALSFMPPIAAFSSPISTWNCLITAPIFSIPAPRMCVCSCSIVSQSTLTSYLLLNIISSSGLARSLLYLISTLVYPWFLCSSCFPPQESQSLIITWLSFFSSLLTFHLQRHSFHSIAQCTCLSILFSFFHIICASFLIFTPDFRQFHFVFLLIFPSCLKGLHLFVIFYSCSIVNVLSNIVCFIFWKVCQKRVEVI